MKYKIKLHKEVISKDSLLFDLKTKEKIKSKCIEMLSQKPEEVGAPLRFELRGYRKLKIFNDYRIIYRVEKQQVFVFILAVEIRRNEEVYKEAVRRLNSSN